MDKKKPSKDERGNVRYLWVLVGAYLLYLAWQQLQLFLRGEVTKTLDILVCGVSGAVFAAVGAWVIYREWRAWQYAQAHKDDPETWNGAPDEENTSADAPELDGDAGAELPDAPELPEANADEAESVPESEEEGAEESGGNAEAPEADAGKNDAEAPEADAGKNDAEAPEADAGKNDAESEEDAGENGAGEPEADAGESESGEARRSEEA